MHDMGSQGTGQATSSLAAGAGSDSTPGGRCTRCKGNWSFRMARQTYRLLFALSGKKTGCRPWGRGPKTKGSEPQGLGRNARQPTHWSTRVSERCVAGEPAPPLGARPRTYPLWPSPSPSIQPTATSCRLSANRHTPRRIALGGVWEGD